MIMIFLLDSAGMHNSVNVKTSAFMDMFLRLTDNILLIGLPEAHLQLSCHVSISHVDQESVKIY